MTLAFRTSYHAMFGKVLEAGTSIRQVEIPSIQRDFAQGREDGQAQRVLRDFLDVIRQTLQSDRQFLSLNFVYGSLEGGAFRPLDGQQRLTTLFLLHWFLSARTGRAELGLPWRNLSYQTRDSSKRFCARLGASHPPASTIDLAAWVRNQNWYLLPWDNDPTIHSMLAVLAQIERSFQDADWDHCWIRLTDPVAPAITFDILPTERLGSENDLYIKMNSRGRLLTPFENFKARFESAIEASHPAQARTFAARIDDAWSDIFWPYRDEGDLIDTAMLGYFWFVTDCCRWLFGGWSAELDMEDLAIQTFATGGPGREDRLDFLIQAFEGWHGVDVAGFFSDLFSSQAAEPQGGPRLFNPPISESVDLFRACCRLQVDGHTRWSWGNRLLLLGALLHKLQPVEDPLTRLRTLRNLIEASEDELRRENLPALAAETRTLLRTGDTGALKTFSTHQIRDENRKAELLRAHPELTTILHPLEDHDLLRGCLLSFDLEAQCLPERAAAFHRLFASTRHLAPLTGAMLTHESFAGRTDGRFFQFGSPEDMKPWRELFRGEPLPSLEASLARVLDRVAAAGDVLESLQAMQAEWLEGAVARDWRYYLIKYPCMREGRSGRYAGLEGRMGYSLCMLDKTRMSSFYRDPYLLALVRTVGQEDRFSDLRFRGYEGEPRRMRLRNSGLQIQCVPGGFAFTSLADETFLPAYETIATRFGLGQEGLLAIRQDAAGIDQEDRIERGSAFLSILLQAGL